MKQLPIKTESYQYIERSFREWLSVLGYSHQSVYGMPNAVREFLHYLETHHITQVAQITNKRIKVYYQYLKTRSNQRRGGALSNNSLNKHLQALQKFSDYLRENGRLELPKLSIAHEKEDTSTIEILTEGEIKELYKCSYQRQERMSLSENKIQALQHRDRAMLSIFYGCGLRRSEGYYLDISDINWDRHILHVRQGKNYKERYVPFSKGIKKHLEDYVYNWRPYLVREGKEDAFFIGCRGRRLGDQSLLLRLKRLIQYSDDLSLQAKEVGLHTLRHSIATHLLSAGMQLGNIAKFLGHSSLESTQLYTHLLKGEEDRIINQDYPNLKKGNVWVQLSEDEKKKHERI